MKIYQKQTFFFVRHAETDWNQQKLCQGQTDIPLNDQGMREAKEFAQSTLNLTFECIVSSPLIRAKQTAKELHTIHNKAKFHLIEKLSERSFGKLEGIKRCEMYAIEEQENKDPSYVPGFQVEPRSVFKERVAAAIIEVQKFHPHPLIVSHGRVFAEICHLLDLPPIQQIRNCQLVQFIPGFNTWKIHFF